MQYNQSERALYDDNFSCCFQLTVNSQSRQTVNGLLYSLVNFPVTY